MIELRYDVLMIDREFERWSVRTYKVSRQTSGLMDDNLSRAGAIGTRAKYGLAEASRDG
jgi:hypothetical protein